MTLEQAVQRILDKQSEVVKLQQEIFSLKNGLKELTPLRVGQKVKVVVSDGYSKTKEIICFITGTKWLGYGVDKWGYTFSKCKKDGTMSEQSAGIYSYDSIEPIND
jgi:hypothetical protein